MRKCSDKKVEENMFILRIRNAFVTYVAIYQHQMHMVILSLRQFDTQGHVILKNSF